MSSIFGKALLVINRLADSHGGFHFDVTPFIQRCTDGIYDRDCAAQEFGHVEWDIHPAPSSAYKLQVGDTVRVAVSFEINFHTYSDGECDSTLHYTKQRVLRRQSGRPRYQTKGARP